MDFECTKRTSPKARFMFNVNEQSSLNDAALNMECNHHAGSFLTEFKAYNSTSPCSVFFSIIQFIVLCKIVSHCLMEIWPLPWLFLKESPQIFLYLSKTWPARNLK